MHQLLNRFTSMALVFFSVPLWAAEDKQEMIMPEKILPAIEPLSFGSVLNMVISLVIVIALIVGIAWVLKRYGRLPASGNANMRLLGGLSVGSRERVLLVEVDNTRIVIGVAPGRVEKLHVLGESSPDDGQAGFERELNDAAQRLHEEQ